MADCIICNGEIRERNHRRSTIEISESKLDSSYVIGRSIIEEILEEHGEGPAHDTCLNSLK